MLRPSARARRALAAAMLMMSALSTGAMAQLRVVAWNVTNYPGSYGFRTAAIQTAVYGEFEGRSLAPDVIITQEFLSQAGVNGFLSALNAAPGSPGDWAAAPFVDGPDTDSAFFYRTGKVEYLGLTVVSVGGVAPNHPRNVQRYDVRPIGYASDGATLACYSTHMKAGNTSSDQQRRLLEAQIIRADAQGLPAGWNFLLGGDFNIPTSSQSAYQFLINSQAINDGRFFDPINTPGSWQNNVNFRFVHTQDPIGAGGMDDRYDQVLVSASLLDGAGMHYVGDADVPYSTTTWDDPNHSYRSWGNDGTSFDTTLRVDGNTMVGPAIAQALITCAANAGHLPVALDMRVPARVASDTLIDFGDVATGESALLWLGVSNGGDVALWGAGGVASLNYTLGASGPFGVDSGPFVAHPGASPNAHAVTLDTSSPGEFMATIEISSDAPDEPVRVVTLLARVVESGPCIGDVNGDGVVDFVDFSAALAAYGACDGDPAYNPDADLDGNGCVDFADFSAVLSNYGVDCE